MSTVCRHPWPRKRAGYIAPRLGLFLFALLIFATGGLGQLPPVKIDPLHPGQMSQGGAACSAKEPSSCAVAAAKITPIVMGQSPLEENLRRLTDEIGGRVSGSPEMDKAVEWAIAAFRAGGVDVHTEKYMLPTAWSEKFPIALVSEALSPPTAADGIEAAIVDVGFATEEDFARAGGTIKGALLLVHSDIGTTWADLFNEYLKPPDIIRRAVAGGAKAILWTGARERKLLYRHTNTDPASGAGARRRDAAGANRSGASGKTPGAIDDAEQDFRSGGTSECGGRDSRL
jgi:hypothetical protein